MVRNEKAIDVMWDMVKHLMNDIEIYKEAMDEDEDSTPNSYLILESDIANDPDSFADNKIRSRESDCNFLLITKGFATKATDLHNINLQKITQALDNAGFFYTGRNLGYVDGLKSTQYSWSGTIKIYK